MVFNYNSRRSKRASYVQLRLILLVLAAIALTGCVSSTPRLPAPVESVNRSLASQELETLFRTEAELWAGTPHVWGGNSRKGIDCSAFTKTVYKDVLAIPLPRTTRDQVKVGAPVQPADLQVGDLVFYRIDPSTRHVGIYVGNNEMMHASKSEGVTISSIDSDYWQKRFWTVRRILESPPPLQEADPPALESDKSKITW